MDKRLHTNHTQPPVRVVVDEADARVHRRHVGPTGGVDTAITLASGHQCVSVLIPIRRRPSGSCGARLAHWWSRMCVVFQGWAERVWMHESKIKREDPCIWSPSFFGRGLLKRRGRGYWADTHKIIILPPPPAASRAEARGPWSGQRRQATAMQWRHSDRYCGGNAPTPSRNAPNSAPGPPAAMIPRDRKKLKIDRWASAVTPKHKEAGGWRKRLWTRGIAR